MCNLFLDSAATAIYYDLLSLWSITKVSSPFKELQILVTHEIMNGHHIRLKTSSKHKTEPV